MGCHPSNKNKREREEEASSLRRRLPQSCRAPPRESRLCEATERLKVAALDDSAAYAKPATHSPGCCPNACLCELVWVPIKDPPEPTYRGGTPPKRSPQPYPIPAPSLLAILASHALCLSRESVCFRVFLQPFLRPSPARPLRPFSRHCVIMMCVLHLSCTFCLLLCRVLTPPSVRV